jgi:hypothetical protein
MMAEFIIKMADGRYYSARHDQDLRRQNPPFTTDIHQATRFLSRWLALGICAQGAQFASATILPYPGATEGPAIAPGANVGQE